MKLFLVATQDEYEELAKKLINEEYTQHNFRLPNRKSPLWVIATNPNMTPAKVADSLNMSDSCDESERIKGAVFQLNEYFGYDSMALWQQLEVWSNEG